MNPGLVVKLRPTGPWRIGPDSGARNKVDATYHSDSLYGAVTSAMARLGSLEEWLDATARSAATSVCFSSCFPFVDEIGFVTPPRTVWPPTTPAALSARVRWKSARFVPLGIVPAILAGDRLDDGKWAVDGPSGCLLPTGRTGPFRVGVRWNAAVDRLSGAAERHSTACLEFRPGAGLWTVISFVDEAARDRWSDPLKAAFRWLADSGFGGERSRGWGRSEAPEFVEGTLPDMIFTPAPPRERKKSPAPVATTPEPAPAPEATPTPERSPAPPVEEPPPAEPPVGEPPHEEPPAREPGVEEPPAEEPPANEPEPLEEASQREKPDIAGFSMGPDDESEPKPDAPAPETVLPTEPQPPSAVEPQPLATPEPEAHAPLGADAPAREGAAVQGEPGPEPQASSGSEPESSPEERAPGAEVPAVESAHEPVASHGEAGTPPAVEQESLANPEPGPHATLEPEPEASREEPAGSAEQAEPEPVARPESQPSAPEPPAIATAEQPPAAAEAEPVSPPETAVQGPPAPAPKLPAYWLLSLYAPSPADSVDWTRGNYALLHRGGRVDTTGDLKKQLPMVAEGSVLVAAAPPLGSAPDVAPAGCAHPVFRAGFAVAIPLGEVS